MISIKEFTFGILTMPSALAALSGPGYIFREKLHGVFGDFIDRDEIEAVSRSMWFLNVMVWQ